MFKNWKITVGGALTALAVFASPVQAQDADVTIGWTAWDDAEVVTKLSAVVLGEMAGRDVELTLSDIPIQYRGVANGDLDAMLMSWQPNTHEKYITKYGDQLTDLGPLYSGTRLGWAVPAYIPEEKLSSISDLRDPEIRKKLSGQIQGIDKDAGLSGLSRDTLSEYGLNYEIQYGSGPLMAKNLGEAIENKEWMVVTAWNPHWIFGKYELRYLDDPKGLFDGEESVHAVVHKGFEERKPQIAGFFKRMNFSMKELEELMAAAEEKGMRPAIVDYIRNNTSKVRYWVTGQR